MAASNIHRQSSRISFERTHPSTPTCGGSRGVLSTWVSEMPSKQGRLFYNDRARKDLPQGWSAGQHARTSL